MNHPVFPEFKPQKFQSGDSVQVDMNGNIVPATIVRMTAGGNYWVRNARGSEVLAQKNDIFPVASVRDTEDTSPDGDSQQENPWQNITPESLAGHLSGGGKAFYSPADDIGLNAPVHDSWMGDQANLEKFVDFDSLRSGSSKLSYDPPDKPKVERFRGLSESEVRTYLQTGGQFKYFDESVKSSKPEGGHSLQDMMQDRESATDENVNAWFNYQKQQEQKKEQPSQQKSKGLDAVQTGLDAAGVADPTPISDGTNMVISLARAAKEPERMGEHLFNAGVSAVSMVPYVGDLAKGLKYGGKAAKASKATKATAKQGAEPAVIDEAVQELFRSGEVEGGARTPADSGSGKPSVIESVKRRFFGKGKDEDSSSPTKDEDSPSTTSGGGSGEEPPVKDKSTATNPDDENIEKNLGGLKDTVVDLTGKFGKATVAVYAFAETQNFLNKAVIEYNRNLLKFNGELTAAYSKLDANRLFRQFEDAQKQASPMSGLIEAQDDLEKARLEFVGDWKVLATDIQTGLTKLATIGTKVLDYISPLEEVYVFIRKWMPWGGDIKPFNGHEDIKRLDEIRKNAADAQKQGRKV